MAVRIPKGTVVGRSVAETLKQPAKRSKYRNRKVVTEEGMFDSQREYKRWCELKMLEKAGKITRLVRQITYPLNAEGGGLVSKYTADFRYIENGETVVEDSKGVKDQKYAIKKRWMYAQYRITIRET